MKSGKNLVELATEIQRRANAKADYVVSTKSATMTEAGSLAFGDKDVVVNDFAHGQIASHVEIPKPYYDRMRAQAPALLADNVNTWFRKDPVKRMVRTLDGNARAFLSDKYRPLENEELAEAVLPVLLDLDVEIMSSEITDRRLYIKAVDKRIVKAIPTGHHLGDGTHTRIRTDALMPAIVISNSEVGSGMLSVQTSLFTEACTNLATFNDRSIRKHHVGARHELAADNVFAMLSDETRRVSDKALWLQVRDVVRGAFDRAKFESLVNKVAGLAEQPIEGDVVEVVKVASKRIGATEAEGKSILDHLIKGGDLTRYGLFNAVTRTAEDLADYDRATEFENAGGLLVDLDPSEWRKIAVAA